jgi:hypothetical protein
MSAGGRLAGARHRGRLEDAKDSVVRCYRLRPSKVFGFKKDEPVAQTRWLFEGE